MNKQAANRCVRIGVSVFFAVAAVALCRLWVASNCGQVLIRGHLPGPCDFGFVFLHGSAGLYVFEGNADWLIASEKIKWPLTKMDSDLLGPQFSFTAVLGSARRTTFRCGLPSSPVVHLLSGWDSHTQSAFPSAPYSSSQRYLPSFAGWSYGLRLSFPNTLQ